MVGGSRGMGTTKHRKVQRHKRIPVSGTAKAAVIRAVRDLKPARLSETEWFQGVAALFAAYRRKKEPRP
jgi:hypothetical protein